MGEAIDAIVKRRKTTLQRRGGTFQKAVHELFKLSTKLPVPAGQSPFHVRGYYYLRLLDHVRKEPGGLGRLLGKLEDESVNEFLQQRFTWNGWYDVFPTMPIYVALSDLHGQDFEEMVRERTRVSAHELVPSVFRYAMQIAQPTALAGSITRIAMNAVDFTRVTFTSMGDGGGSGSGSGIPLYAAPNVANLVLGFFSGGLELSGASDIEARYTDVFQDGDKNGFPTVTVKYEFFWKRVKRLRGR